MEGILTSLLASGPWGVLCAILMTACVVLFGTWRSSEAELKAEIRRGVEALHTSTTAIREANASRESLLSAFEENHRLSKEILGRIERLISLIDKMDRTIEIQEARRGVQ
jgi:hypothetical protein